MRILFSIMNASGTQNTCYAVCASASVHCVEALQTYAITLNSLPQRALKLCHSDVVNLVNLRLTDKPESEKITYIYIHYSEHSVCFLFVCVISKSEWALVFWFFFFFLPVRTRRGNAYRNRGSECARTNTAKAEEWRTNYLLFSSLPERITNSVIN